MLVDDGVLAAEGLIEGDAVVRQPQQPGQPALAVLDRLSLDDARISAARSRRWFESLSRDASIPDSACHKNL